MDEATRIQDKVAGLSEEQVDKHYVHYVEENHSPIIICMRLLIELHM